MAPSLGVRSCAGGLLLAALGTPSGAGAQPTPVGPEFQVNTYTTNLQRLPSIAADADGDFVVVWERIGLGGGEIIGNSAHGQRYTTAAVVPSLSPTAVAGAALLMLVVGIALRRRN